MYMSNNRQSGCKCIFVGLDITSTDSEGQVYDSVHLTFIAITLAGGFEMSPPVSKAEKDNFTEDD